MLLAVMPSAGAAPGVVLGPDRLPVNRAGLHAKQRSVVLPVMMGKIPHRAHVDLALSGVIAQRPLKRAAGQVLAVGAEDISVAL